MSSYAVGRIRGYYPTVNPELIQQRLSYATYVSIERRYLYCEVPKAGCTSMKTLIHAVEGMPPVQPLRGPMRETRRDMFIHDRGELGLPSLLDFDDEMQRHILTSPDFFRFTVVRNPYARLESAWKDKVRLCAPNYEYFSLKIKGALPRGDDPSSIVSFEEFVNAISTENLLSCDHHWRLQTAVLLYPGLNFSYVGRLEEFSLAIDRFLRWVGRQDLTGARSINRSEGLNNYSEELARKVYELYKDDFVAFGYHEDSWQRRASDRMRHRSFVPEAKYVDEIIERNIIMSKLYDAREEMATRISVKGADYLKRYEGLPFGTLFDRYISKIDGWLTRDEARLLYDLAKSLRHGCIIEIGSYRGRSTSALAFGSLAGAQIPLFAIDPHDPFVGPFGGRFGPIDRGHFMQKMVELGLFHLVHLVNIGSELMADNWLLPVSLLWIDGDHRYDSVTRDLMHWSKHVPEDGILLFDDATTPESGPERLVREILAGGDFEHVGVVGKIVQLRRSRQEIA